jgi:4-hydroxythreonine-4-phosphate dehydrogenase
MSSMKPKLAITMGDPAGIGPELCIKALVRQETYQICNPVIIGALSPLQKAAEAAGIQCLSFNVITSVKEACFTHGTIDVLDIWDLDFNSIEPGKVSKISGGHSFNYVKTAIDLALSKDVDATVTNAISKEAINLAGHLYAGHTEIYAHLTGTSKYTMMLAHGPLRVVHVSTHVSLREACDLVKRGRVLDVIRIAHAAYKMMGIANPKIGVAGLNPHSGESGMFGTEEIHEIIPAIEEAASQGIVVEGPIPPDTIFPKARGGWYDIVVAMYHDQGHIPLKMEGFIYNKAEKKWSDVSGVNITLNLPVIRTSVDHGVAFDQAYKGTASPGSLINAIEYAAAFARNR